MKFKLKSKVRQIFRRYWMPVILVGVFILFFFGTL